MSETNQKLEEVTSTPSEVSTTDSTPVIKTGVKSGPDVILEG